MPPASIFHETFEISNFCTRPWPTKISCQNNFPGHSGPTNTTSEYLSTNWRAEIKICRADLAQFTKTSWRCPKFRLAFFMLRRPGPRAILLDGKRNTVSTSHVILEMATAAPQGIEIRVSERIWSFFLTWGATSVNISWNFRNFGFCIWPWSCKISSQNDFPGHRGPTNTTSEYLSTNWRAEIKIYRADLAQFTKTWPRCLKIRLAFFMLRRL